jgi:hypothetical protein
VKIVVEFSGAILTPNATYARNSNRFHPVLISPSYKNGYDNLCHPFYHLLIVLEAVKFMPLTQGNYRSYILSLFWVHADSVGTVKAKIIFLIVIRFECGVTH